MNKVFDKIKNGFKKFNKTIKGWFDEKNTGDLTDEQIAYGIANGSAEEAKKILEILEEGRNNSNNINTISRAVSVEPNVKVRGKEIEIKKVRNGKEQEKGRERE